MIFLEKQWIKWVQIKTARLCWVTYGHQSDYLGLLLSCVDCSLHSLSKYERAVRFMFDDFTTFWFEWLVPLKIQDCFWWQWVVLCFDPPEYCLEEFVDTVSNIQYWLFYVCLSLDKIMKFSHVVLRRFYFWLSYSHRHLRMLTNSTFMFWWNIGNYETIFSVWLRNWTKTLLVNWIPVS